MKGCIALKDAFIKVIVTGDIDPTVSETLTDRNVILDNDTAVVVGVATAHGTAKGKPITTPPKPDNPLRKPNE